MTRSHSCPSVTLRRAAMTDAAFLLRLRNDAETLAQSLSTEAVSPEGHAEWMAESLTSPTRHLYVAEMLMKVMVGVPGSEFGSLDWIPVGTARLDRWGSVYGEPGRETAEVSITVSPEHRGQGYSEAILAALRAEAAGLGIRRLVATVKPGNPASLRAFLASGYGIQGTRVLTLEREV